MVVTSRPSTTDAAAVAAVLADIDMSSIGPDEGNATVVTDCDDNSSSNPQTNNDDDWRNEVDDKSIRRQIIMHMFKLLSEAKPPQPSARWRRKLPALIRLIEAAHYRISPTKEVYTDITNLKGRVRKLAMAFHNEMKKHGNRTFHVPSHEKMHRRLRTPPFIILNEEAGR